MCVCGEFDYFAKDSRGVGFNTQLGEPCSSWCEALLCVTVYFSRMWGFWGAGRPRVPRLNGGVSFPQFHSHQLFHVFVVAGAFVHFHGVSNLQEFRFTVGGGCTEEDGMQ